MGIDDESSHPELCSEVAGGVTRNLVCLFREPDAGNLPVRFDEREQETESGPTGLRRAKRKLSPTATGRLKPLRLFSTLLAITLIDRLAGHFLGCEPTPSFASSATLPSALSELRQSFYGRLGTLCVLCGH